MLTPIPLTPSVFLSELSLNVLVYFDVEYIALVNMVGNSVKSISNR